ncbi:ATPase [Gordoniibacillus kamchatkensis]|uniref:ATPase n=1 Tax=Gordoniibacillus kamchatkensis TaxID=1590651 RepID=A0ABR5ADY3_9BACL|nr:BadF/BadG/BcrA/BcrD ATPase family protein [Paenibacillus sp. VKM B-2647]KIL39155.1 ATPase [Paenibacillus sp. VKM B-2647]
MAYIMGMDGGGSKTFAVITDEEGRLLGRGVAGPGNYQVSGLVAVVANYRAAAAMALQQAGLRADDIDFVQYGLAGADRQKDFGILLPALAQLPFRHWDLVCDTMEGLRAGSPDNVGVVLVCGSGTNAAGRNRQGKAVQTGGFGELFGDRTGGGHLAKEAFSCAVRSWELREMPTALTDKIPQYLGYASMEETVNRFLDNDIYEVPRDLAIVLHEAAAEGDELSIRLLREAGRELGLAAVSVIRRLGGTGTIDGFGDETIPVVLIGSVVQEGRSPHLLGALSDTIAAACDRFELVIPRVAPVYGAVMLAMDRLKLPVTEQMMGRFIEYGGYR